MRLRTTSSTSVTIRRRLAVRIESTSARSVPSIMLEYAFALSAAYAASDFVLRHLSSAQIWCSLTFAASNAHAKKRRNECSDQRELLYTLWRHAGCPQRCLDGIVQPAPRQRFPCVVDE